MKILAIYKTFRGDEFVIPSLESIYAICDKILFMHCDKSWTGKKGNTVKPIVDTWAKENDTEKKIISVTAKNCDQTATYLEAWKVAEKIDHDWKLLIDTDEVYSKGDIEKIGKTAETTKYDVLACGMHEYIKSPLFRIYPTPPLRPVVMVRNGVEYKSVRCFLSPNKGQVDACFHHFTLVRRTLSEIVEKQSECCNIEGVNTVEWEKWISQKWNALPKAKNLKPLDLFTTHWEGVKPINLSELPETMQNHPLTLAFSRYNFTHRHGGRAPVDMTEAFKKFNVPEGFDPGHPRWGVPSVMHRYEQALQYVETEELSAVYERYSVPIGYCESHPKWDVPSIQNRYKTMMDEIRDNPGKII